MWKRGIVPTFPAENGGTEAADEGTKMGRELGDVNMSGWKKKLG